MKKNNRKQSENKNKEYYDNEKSRLREFLANLKDEGTIEEDYSETPIYRMGYDDGYSNGYDEGYSKGYYELYKVLKVVETVIEPHLEEQ